MHYILYKTTNLINGKIYIGIHKITGVNDNYLGSGFLIKRAIKKYGRENFERCVLYTFDTLDEATAMEKEIVNEEFRLREDTYNLATGGGLGGNDINGLTFKGCHHTEDTIEKIRSFRKGKNFITPQGIENIKHACRTNQARKDNISQKLSGRKLSESTKQKISDSLKNRKRDKIPRGYKRRSKQIWITNGIKNTRISVDQAIPDGWFRGRIQYSRVC